jgi:type II secretory pathway predicted ATPase ExeA
MNTQTIITEAKAFLERKGMSQEELGDKIGYSGAVVSQLLSGKYPGDAEQVLRKLAQHIGYNPLKWEILNTFNFTAVKNVCLEAQEGQRMLALYGDTGTGKTTALQKYYQASANCYYVLANVLMKPKDLLKAIQKEVGDDQDGTLNERLDRIVSKLESKKFPLLIIEDCGKLEHHNKCFGIIQLLFDRLQNRCGIVLAGTKRFAVYFNKMAAKDVLGFRELKRRISYWQPLMDGVEKKFIQTVCQRHNITMREAVDYFLNNCTNYGDVHELIRNFNKYKELKKIDTDEQLQILSSLKFNKLQESI